MKLKVPNTYVIIFFILLLCAVSTWFVPGGKPQTWQVFSGQAINKVPDKTTVYLDFRICDSENEQDKIRNTVEEALKEFDVEYEKINDIPSLLNRGERVGWYEEMTGKESCAGTGITEASFFGGDRVIIGPGPKTAHQKNECVSLESLEASAQLYLTAIKRECL